MTLINGAFVNMHISATRVILELEESREIIKEKINKKKERNKEMRDTEINEEW